MQKDIGQSVYKNNTLIKTCSKLPRKPLPCLEQRALEASLPKARLVLFANNPEGQMTTSTAISPKCIGLVNN